MFPADIKLQRDLFTAETCQLCQKVAALNLQRHSWGTWWWCPADTHLSPMGEPSRWSFGSVHLQHTHTHKKPFRAFYTYWSHGTAVLDRVRLVEVSLTSTEEHKRAKLFRLSFFFISVRVGTWLAQIGFRLLARRRSQWRRMSGIMNKRQLCHKCSFGSASWCVGKSRPTSASSRTQLQVLCMLKWEKVHGSSRSNLKHIRGCDWNLCQFN